MRRRGTFIVANPVKVIKDAGKGIVEALKNAEPKEADYLAVLGVLYALMTTDRGGRHPGRARALSGIVSR
jgi:flagellar motor component MotA